MSARARGRRRAPTLRVEVSDTGIGIDADELDAAVRAVHAGRHLDHAALRRHRPRARDLDAARRADGRRDRRSTARRGHGSTLLVRRAARPRDDRHDARTRARAWPCRENAARADRGRQRHEPGHRLGVPQRAGHRLRPGRQRAGGARDARGGRARRPAVRGRRPGQPDARHERSRRRRSGSRQPAPPQLPRGDADLHGRPVGKLRRSRRRPLPHQARPAGAVAGGRRGGLRERARGARGRPADRGRRRRGGRVGCSRSRRRSAASSWSTTTP